MIFGNKYDVESMKKAMDKAEKNFNLSKTNSSDKEPNAELFKTKIWFKMYALTNKSYEKAKKVNPIYYKQVEDTKGDYSRRGKNVGEQVKTMYTYIKNEIKKTPDLKYTIAGVFVDTYDNLCDTKWRQAYKIAYDYCDKNKDESSLAIAYKLMYFSQVYTCESLMIKLLDYEYKIVSGVNPLDAIQYTQEHNRAMMDKLVMPSINLNALIRSVKDPVKIVRSYINGERNAAKGSEGFQEPLTSEEGAFFETLKKSSGNLLMLVAEGAAGVAAAIVAAGTSPLAAAAIGIVAGVIFIFLLIPTIRLIIYYSYASEIDMVKELELNKELLENNIAVLQERYNSLGDGPEKDKLGKVIENQKAEYENIQKKIGSYSEDVNSEAIEHVMEADEAEADSEANDAALDTGTDGEPEEESSSNGDDFSIEI